MSQYAVPGALVAGHPAARPQARGVGRRARPIGTEAAARVDAILAALADGRAPLVEAGRSPTTRCSPCTRRSCWSSCARRPPRWAEGPYDELVGQDRVVPYLFPTPGDDGRAARAAGSGRARGRRPVRLRHDDAGRAGHLGGGPGGGGLRDRARRRWSPAGTRLAYALCRPPGHHATPAGFGGSCYLNNAAVAAASLRDAGLRAGRDRRRRRAPGQRDRRDLLRPGRRAVRVGARRPGGRLVPARGRVRVDETGSGPGLGATRNLPLAPGTGDPEWLAAVARPGGLGGRGGLRGAGRVAGRRRGRRRPGEPAAGHRRTATARRVAPRRRPGCPRSSSRRAATTCPPSVPSSLRTWRAMRTAG